MAAILDANALINLYHADILPLAIQRVECIIPAEVYEEVILGGRQAGHPDAETIEGIIGLCTEEPAAILPELSNFGLGEAAVLTRYLERQRSARHGEDVMVSDDRQFLRYLDTRERQSGEAIRRWNTAQFIAESALNGLMTKGQALSALSSIRSRMPEQFYNRALQRLESL